MSRRLPARLGGAVLVLAAGCFTVAGPASATQAGAPEAEQTGGPTRPIRARPWPERPVSEANKSGNETVATPRTLTHSLTLVDGDGFADIGGAGVHRGAVEALDAAGILTGTGCAPDRLCPQAALPRWAMAVWLVRALDGQDPATARRPRFADVPAGRWWAPHVERLADLRITRGCGTGPARFCPDAPVTRAQMASFLKRAFRFGPAGAAGFADTGSSPHASAIDALAAAGITTGCAADPPRYCPDTPVTRAQMASLLVRAMRFNAVVTWLSAGDSYSSGVGTDPHARGSCRRSPNAAGPAAAGALARLGWAIVHTHTACAGGLVEDMFNPRPSGESPRRSMWEEHTSVLGGAPRVDVLTLSLGGNDVGFEDVVLACVPFTRITELFAGCPSQGGLQARIDGLVAPARTCADASRTGSRPDYQCALRIGGGRHGSIADFYREIVSERLTARGRLYVIGYPSLIAPSSEWRLLDPCWLVYKPETVDMLGRLAEHLNRQLASAVRRANEVLGEVRVHYVDTHTPFREGRHEVCGRGADYLHGITHVGLDPLTGWYRSFHLNNAGHAEVARRLADEVASTFRASIGLAPRSLQEAPGGG